MWLQKNILVGPCSRGFHIITDLIINEVPEIEKINIGVLHLFIKHTSASLTLNENADQTHANIKNYSDYTHIMK